MLCDAVDGGDSVSFMDGFGTDDARAFYASLLPELEAGTRVLLAAYVDGELVGTVQLVHAWPPNSQHRADVAKLLVHRRVRGQGGGAGADGATGAGGPAPTGSRCSFSTPPRSVPADRLYDRLGWTRLGTVPGYRRDPDGSFCDATRFYKHL